ncbi:MAG: hypothetical protein GY950_22150, partial [bacterium]|nr:hypothetical protein [bacterium]
QFDHVYPKNERVLESNRFEESPFYSSLSCSEFLYSINVSGLSRISSCGNVFRLTCLSRFPFQEFYSENAEAWLERFTFKESAHHLLLMAFLQRLVNAGGEIVREMAVGNGRIDLLVKFHKQRTAMELKINRGKKSIEKAKIQLDRYLDRLGLTRGYLVLFDPGKGDWEKKLYMREITYNQKKIIMV